MLTESEMLRKEIGTIKTLRQAMAGYFHEMDEASKTGSKKIAWCSSVGPAELLRGMGFLVFQPENHGAILGAFRMATDLIPFANALGYSPDICSYLTSDLGSYIRKKHLLPRLTNQYPSRICLFLTATSVEMCRIDLNGIQGN